jgi:phospholipid/cholesterol/gamma-HCH transport system permease protein
LKFLEQIGSFFLMLKMAFTKPEKFSIFWRNFLEEIYKIGISSLSIVAILSLFMGAVMVIQTASNIDSPLIPGYTIGFATRQSIILEFSSTMICLILAGKVGSNIASEIGTMKLTEQIDALEVMGINSINHLILPKIVASVFIFPFLVLISMGLGLFGGGLIGTQSGIVTLETYTYGLQYWFEPFSVTYSLIKTVFFAFFIAAIPSFYGYYVKPSGGALEVGRAGTKSVVVSSVVVLIINLLLTYFLLL